MCPRAHHRQATAARPLLALLLLAPAAAGLQMIWQISDIHVDGDYAATGSPEGWCRPDTAGAGPERWFGQLGCGLPWRTVQSAVDAMRERTPGADAVLWTGDTAPHWPYPDWTHVFPKLRRVTAMLRAAFPHAQLLPSIGNHDAYPSDQFPADNGTFYHAYLEQSGWAEVLPEPAQRTFRRGGYYAVTAAGLRFIVLNTALYYNRNRLIRDAGDDPTGQLAWLEEQLADRRRPTVVSAHISPGFPHWSVYQTSLHSAYNYKLVQLLSRHGLEARVANIFGHEHIDTFQNVYRQDITFAQHTSALNTYLMAPALMPGTKTQHVNPSVRAYVVLGGKLNDYLQYHFDIEAANEAHRGDPDVSPLKFWKQTYVMRELYGLSDLTTRSMHLLFKMIKEDDGVFQKYWAHTGGLHPDRPACNATCKKHRLCVMSSHVYQSMQQCMDGAGRAAAPLLLVLLAGLAARLAV